MTRLVDTNTSEEFTDYADTDIDGDFYCSHCDDDDDDDEDDENDTNSSDTNSEDDDDTNSVNDCVSTSIFGEEGEDQV